MKKLKRVALIALIVSIILVISQKNTLHLLLKTRERPSERSLIEDFVDYSMIRYFGVYTLFGFKPITEMDVQYEPPSEKYRKYLYENLPREKKEEIPYREFIVNSPWGVSIKMQWEAFKEEMEKHPLKNHFFVEYRFDYKQEEYTSILFVHQSSLVEVLEKYHIDFERELGEKFNSFEKVLELKSGGSKFWDKIFKDTNHYLMGLLFGYGEKNAKNFEIEQTGKEDLGNRRLCHVSLEEIKNTFKDKISIEDLCLPNFISYDINDEVIDDYQEKRKFIVEYFKKKNFTDEVFKILERGWIE